MHIKLKKLPLYISAALMAGTAPLTTLAQDEPSLQLEEVMVTARKRTESLQSAPVSAAVFDSSALQRAQINDISEIIGRVPGFVMNSDNVTEPNVFMRGIGTDIESAASNSSIGMFVNEVYMARAQAFAMELFDLQQVEVVRGPQGILYGKNVTGGVVNFVTNKPTDNDEASVRAGVGNYDLIEVEGFANGALSDTVYGRISATSRSRDGYGKNTHTDNDVEDFDASSVRGQLRFVPSEDLDIILSADTNRRRGTAPWVHMEIPSEHNEPFQNSDERRGPNNIDGKSDADVDGVDLTINWSTDAGTLTSITALRKASFEHKANDGGSYIDFSTLPYGDDGRVDFVELHFGDGPGPEAYNDDFFVNDKEEDVDTFSQELRWTSTLDGNWNYMVGGYYLEEEIERQEQQTYLFVNFWNQGYESAYTESDNSTYGVFGEVTWDITDAWNLVVGARYTYDEKDFSVIRGNEGDYLGAPFEDENGNIISGFSASDSDDWDSIDPSVTLNWQVSDDVFAYASYSTGFKSGGWNGENATSAGEAVAGYDEEEATNYEIGAKMEFFDNRLRVNATGFFTTYDDLQTQQFVIFDENLPPDNVIANAGEAEVKGVELEFMGLVTDWWTISGTYAYQDGEITGDLISTELQYNPECDCSNIRVDVNLKGNELRRTPENSYNLVNTFFWDMGNSGSMDVVIDYSYTDGYHFDNENNPRTYNEDFSVWNASVNWTSADDKWELSLWGKNLDDELYATGKVDVIGSVLASYAPPRTYGASVRWFMQ